jgi:hypothetical protein
LTLAVLGAAFSAESQTNVSVRNFEFTYLTRIPASPLGAKTLKIWIPLPQSDPYQAIGTISVTCTGGPLVTKMAGLFLRVMLMEYRLRPHWRGRVYLLVLDRPWLTFLSARRKVRAVRKFLIVWQIRVISTDDRGIRK